MTANDTGQTVSKATPRDQVSRDFSKLITGKDVPTQREQTPVPPALVFSRLLPRYEREFGAEPPIVGLDVETANRRMREALARAGALAGGTATPTHRH